MSEGPFAVTTTVFGDEPLITNPAIIGAEDPCTEPRVEMFVSVPGADDDPPPVEAEMPNFIAAMPASAAPTSGAAPKYASLKFAMRTPWSYPAVPAASWYMPPASLCHPLPVTKVMVNLEITAAGVEIEAEVRVTGKTGVEMEALTAVSVAALTLYDMVKAVDKGAVITDIRLEEKSGGKSGDFHRAPDAV